MILYGILASHGRCLRLLPDKHMVRTTIELVQNQSFILTIGDSKESRICHLKNGVSQGSVWVLFFNLFIYTSASALHNLLKFYLRRQSSIVALLCKLKGL